MRNPPPSALLPLLQSPAISRQGCQGAPHRGCSPPLLPQTDPASATKNHPHPPTHRGNPWKNVSHTPPQPISETKGGGGDTWKSFVPPGEPRSGGFVRTRWLATEPHQHTHTHTHTLGSNPWLNFHRDPEMHNTSGITIIEKIGWSQSLRTLLCVSQYEERKWVGVV